MADGELLLREVLANPAENTVRLVYADWLEENGEPLHAEYIRLQIKHNKGESNRRSVLTKKLTVKWASETGLHQDPHFYYLETERGFINRVVVHSFQLPLVAPLLNKHPITEINLMDRVQDHAHGWPCIWVVNPGRPKDFHPNWFDFPEREDGEGYDITVGREVAETDCSDAAVNWCKKHAQDRPSPDVLTKTPPRNQSFRLVWHRTTE